ncbi:hypothetical protein BGP_0725 [Beggiatoa sp. PS]|nr:hypothetical protein BGP_0725 [Beggiatoa sp. PS]
MVDPRAIKVKLAKEGAHVIANECPRYQLLKSNACSKDRLDIHNFFVFYLLNVRGICGPPVKWEPSQAEAPIKPFFDLLSEPNKRFAKLYKFHEQPDNGIFRKDIQVKEKNFFILFYLDFLAESIRVKEVDFVYQEFLGPREDIIDKYPMLGYLRRLLHSLMVRGGL